MRRHIEVALQATGGRIEGPTGAARRLEINPHTLRARMTKLGIVRSRFRGGQPTHDRVDEPVVSLDDAMANHIRRVLQVTAGRIEGPHGAARRLEINPHTLRARMRKLGVVAREFRPARARCGGGSLTWIKPETLRRQLAVRLSRWLRSRGERRRRATADKPLLRTFRAVSCLHGGETLVRRFSEMKGA